MENFSLKSAESSFSAFQRNFSAFPREKIFFAELSITHDIFCVKLSTAIDLFSKPFPVSSPELL